LEMVFHVPQAKAAQGHALHPGPLYMRSIVERMDGSLVALMAGWFKGDDTPCPYNVKRPYSRTYTCESKDGGTTWDYLSTIGYDHIGSEGYNEGVMETLPDGRLIAVLRTGSMSDPKCQDNPIMVSTSDDGGATWSKPRRTGAHGAFPDLAVLSDGTLALSYGRPGANIAFSRDHGLTWSDHTSVDPTPYSGYTSITEIGPGEILMAFGTKGRIDPQNGDRSDGIRVARIQYAEQRDVAPLASLDQAGVSVVALGDGFYDCSFYSKSLKRNETFALHLPESYAPDQEELLPLIVFLHGSGRHHLSLIEMPQSRGVIRNSSAVFLSPNGSQSWWVDSPVDQKSQYASFLDECIALVTEHLAVSRDPQQRAIGGWSMGGFGSVHYAEKHSDDFRAWAGIVALLDFPNANYSAGDNHSVPAVLGNEAQQAAFNPLHGATALKGMNIMMVTADAAFDCKMNEAFSETLAQHEIPHTFSTLEGSHTIQVVQKAFPQVMAFFHKGFDTGSSRVVEENALSF
jgi:S-formylglutathione hydrolase FrmB